jgi:hypothetical protein
MGGAGGSTGAGGALNVPRIGPGGSIVNPGSISRNSNRGMSYSTTDSSGNNVTYESPTAASSSAIQNRIGASNEAHTFVDPVLQGIKPYQGAWGAPSFSFLKDSALAEIGNQDAKQKMNLLALAQKFGPEAALVIARMSATHVGSELANQLRHSIEGGTPPQFLLEHGIPQSAREWANKQYLDLQKQGVLNYAKPARDNYPVEMDDKPQYAQITQKPLSNFVRNAMTPEQIAQYEAQQAQNNPTQPPTQNSNIPDEDTIRGIAAKNNMSIEDVRKRAHSLFAGNK